MNSISLADAEGRLSELVDRVAAGETVSITRQGKAVAQLIAAEPPREKIDAAGLRKMTDRMPKQSDTASSFVRKMRDEDRF